MVTTEGLITLSEAAQILPKINGKRPSTVTLHRWATAGLRGVKLESSKIGGRRVTSPEALDAFIERVNGAAR